MFPLKTLLMVEIFLCTTTQTHLNIFLVNFTGDRKEAREASVGS